MNIDIKVKTYEQLKNEVIILNTNSYLKDLKIEQLQSNWNSLREWLEQQHQFIIEIPAYTKEISIEHKTMETCYENVLDKMNELEGDKK